MSDRHDLRPAPPYDKYGLPGVSFPTNDPSEFAVIVEDVSVASEGYEPLDAYTAHAQTGGSTGIATAVLTLEIGGKGDGNRKNVRRVYETLPGPWVYDTRYDDDLGPVQIRRRPVRFDTANIGAATATGKTTFTARGDSPLVSLETQEAWSDGTGSPGNPAYPIPKPTYRYDRERGSIKRTTQVVVPTGSEVASIAFVATAPMVDAHAGTVTRIEYEPLGDFLLRKITETFALPGPLLEGDHFDPETEAMVYESTQLVHAGATQPSITDYFTGFDAQSIDVVTQRFVIRRYPSTVVDHTGVVEFKPDRFTFPAILHGLSGTISAATFTGAVIAGTYKREPERPSNFNAKHTTVFTTTAPTAATADAGILNFREVQHRLQQTVDGTTVEVNSLGPVLCDAFEITDFFVGEATTPTASAYVSARTAGSYFVVARPSRKLAKQLWAVTTIEWPYL